jgi:hypothetical protein
VRSRRPHALSEKSRHSGATRNDGSLIARENLLGHESFAFRSLTSEAPSDDHSSLLDPNFVDPSAGRRRIDVYIFQDTPPLLHLYLCAGAVMTAAAMAVSLATVSTPGQHGISDLLLLR